MLQNYEFYILVAHNLCVYSTLLYVRFHRPFFLHLRITFNVLNWMPL